MGVWSVGIVDTGVVDEYESAYGANLYEWDFYYENGSTDGGRIVSHGSYVAQTIEQTNAALEHIDLKVAPNSESFISLSAATFALNKLIALNDAGWHIGAYNLSWGGSIPFDGYVDEIDALADRGIFAVAAAGNGGAGGSFEFPAYPARLDNVIAVGSHDGAGNPSYFSQDNPGSITVLADGEDIPVAGASGTSFAAPQVTAGVATVQALADSALEHRLSYDETVDVLQQGGGAQLSAPDPFDGTTRYYLYDFDGSKSYFLAKYLDPEFSGYEYMASYGDIETTFAGDPTGARDHFVDTGVYEGREVTFDGLEYIASYADLIAALGTDRAAGAEHYLASGRAEGRAVTFEGAAYLAANPDLQAAFGDDVAAAIRHYIALGHSESRLTALPIYAAYAPDPTAVQTAYTSSADGLL